MPYTKVKKLGFDKNCPIRLLYKLDHECFEFDHRANVNPKNGVISNFQEPTASTKIVVRNDYIQHIEF